MARNIVDLAAPVACAAVPSVYAMGRCAAFEWTVPGMVRRNN
jgi:hypothetical protein